MMNFARRKKQPPTQSQQSTGPVATTAVSPAGSHGTPSTNSSSTSSGPSSAIPSSNDSSAAPSPSVHVSHALHHVALGGEGTAGAAAPAGSSSRPSASGTGTPFKSPLANGSVGGARSSSSSASSSSSSYKQKTSPRDIMFAGESASNTSIASTSAAAAPRDIVADLSAPSSSSTSPRQQNPQQQHPRRRPRGETSSRSSTSSGGTRPRPRRRARVDEGEHDNATATTTTSDSFFTTPRTVLPRDVNDAPSDAIVSLVGDMLTRLMSHNDTLPLDPTSLTRFHSRATPGISIQSYLVRISKYTSLEKACTLILLVYIDRVCEASKGFTICSLTAHRFVCAALVCASKALCDAFSTNGHYARVGGISLVELNMLEKEFLGIIDWRLTCTGTLLQHYYESLVASHPRYVLEEEEEEEDEENEEEEGGRNSEDGGGGEDAAMESRAQV